MLQSVCLSVSLMFTYSTAQSDFYFRAMVGYYMVVRNKLDYLRGLTVGFILLHPVYRTVAGQKVKSRGHVVIKIRCWSDGHACRWDCLVLLVSTVYFTCVSSQL